MIRMYKYSDGEYSFLMVDGRNAEIPRFRKTPSAHALCLVHEVDGIAIVGLSGVADYSFEFHGKEADSTVVAEHALACSVAYADLLGVKAFHSQDYSVDVDGSTIQARIESHLGECKEVVINDKCHSTLCLGEIE